MLSWSWKIYIADLLFRQMLSFLKTIFFKLYLNWIGAVYLVKENVIRPRRLADYPSQGEVYNVQ